MNIGQVLVGAGAAAFPAASAGAAAAGRLAAATIGHAATSRSRAAGTVTIAAGGAPGGATQTAAQRQAEELGALLTRLVRGAVTGTSTPATSGSSGTSGSLAFLKDSRLSVEEKLARLMAQLSDKYEKQLEQKLRQFGDLDAGKTGSPSSTKKSSSTSALSSLGSGLTSLLSKAGLGKDLLTGTFLTKLATQVAGPVLAGAATALGLPALAPLILKAGPLLGNVASGALAGLTGAATSGKSSTSKASTSSTSSTSSSSSADAPSEKQLMTEIQILQEKQKEMFSLVSNVLRSMHDTKMAVIGNVR